MNQYSGDNVCARHLSATVVGRANTSGRSCSWLEAPESLAAIVKDHSRSITVSEIMQPTEVGPLAIPNQSEQMPVYAWRALIEIIELDVDLKMK